MAMRKIKVYSIADVGTDDYLKEEYDELCDLLLEIEELVLSDGGSMIISYTDAALLHDYIYTLQSTIRSLP